MEEEQREEVMKRKSDRNGSRSESLWAGSSVDKPGNEAQAERASASRAPAPFPSYYTYKVVSVHPQASQDYILPLQIKMSTCTTEINYRHQAGSSHTPVWNDELNMEAESFLLNI